MSFFSNDRGAEIVGKVKALQTLGTTKSAIDQLYGILGVLDTKATGLLTVNTLFMAILSVFLAERENAALKMGLHITAWVLEAQLVLAAISSLLCLLVIRVTWNFFGRVPARATTAADFDAEFAALAHVIYDRTHYFGTAWLLALLAFVSTLSWWSWWAFAVAFVLIVVLVRFRG